MRALRIDGLRQVLCLGAHSDDIEIGAGGTVLTLLAAQPDVEIHWVVFSATGARADEARESAKRFLHGCERAHVTTFDFRDGFFPYFGAQVKEQFEALKSTCSPDLILTHHRADLHQDHRLIGELTWNTFRDHLILEYEIPKYDGGLPPPNFYVTLDSDTVRRKIDILMDVFATQRSKRWFVRENFEALLRLRGLESNAEHGFAEGFHCAKARLAPGVRR